MDEKKNKIEVEELEGVSGGLVYRSGEGFFMEAGDVTTIDGVICSCGSAHFEATSEFNIDELNRIGRTSFEKFTFRCANPECGIEIIV